MKLFIWDVPILVIAGFLCALVQKRIADKHPDFSFHVGTVITLLMWLSALFSAFGVDPWFGIIKSGVAKDVNGWLAFFLVMSYPLWFIWGARRAFATFGRSPRQGGFIWVFTIEDKTKPFEPAWKVDSDQPHE